MTRGIDWVGVAAPNRQYRAKQSVLAGWPKQVERVTGVTVTADSTIHTKGAWAQLFAATARPCQMIGLLVTGVATSNTNTAQLMDIGIGAAASETVLIPNIPVGSASDMTLLFPVGIPQGTRVSARIQALISSDTATVSATMYECPRFFNVPSTIVQVNTADTANSRGVNLPSNDTYVQMTAATTQPFQALVIVPSSANTTQANAVLTWTVGVGASGAEVVWGTALGQTFTSEAITRAPEDYTMGICPGFVATGSRVAAKVTTGGVPDVAVYGIPA